MLCFQPLGNTSVPQPSTRASNNKPPSIQSPPKSATIPLPSPKEDWPYLVAQLKLTAIARQFAENCALERQEGETFYLQLASNMANLHNQRTEDRLRQAIEEYYGSPIQLVIRIGDINLHSDTVATRRKKEQEMHQQAAVKSIQDDANIKAFCETFNTHLPLDSVRPLIEPEQK
jgi:DNA polymerase III subunit gamma/tau